ncbi:MAG TPA: hypothetical protein VMV78_02770 [Thiobacillus sp.]|nr:hypothetical protein [Thiobacillus sp.]
MSFQGFDDDHPARIGGANSEPPFAPLIRALSAAPLATLAEVAQLRPEALRERLTEAGLQPVSGEQSLSELAGPDLRRQVQILGLLFTDPK